MAQQTQHRQVGDLVQTIAGQCVRPDGTVVVVTGKTIKFSLVDEEGNSVVSEAAADIEDGATGKVRYSPAAGDVDSAGTFYAYFHVYTSTIKETFPVKEGDYKIVIHPKV